MTPYYQHAGITIYYGDYRDILPSMAFDALVTDPPYGTGWARGGKGVGQFDAKHEQPSWDVFSLQWLECAGNCWAAFCPPSQSAAMWARADAEAKWRKTNPRPRGPDYDHIFFKGIALPPGMEWRGYNGDTPNHPCEKPESLMLWILGFIRPRWVIVDPFLGSGTTLVAAKRLGRTAIGIEREESYCEIAATRLQQERLPLDCV